MRARETERGERLKNKACGCRQKIIKIILWIFTHCHVFVICDTVCDSEIETQRDANQEGGGQLDVLSPLGSSSLSLYFSQGVWRKNITYYFLQSNANAVLLNISQCSLFCYSVVSCHRTLDSSWWAWSWGENRQLFPFSYVYF